MAWSSEIQAVIDRDFPSHAHPYRILERTILEHVGPGAVVLDIGCGRRAPNLMKLEGRAGTLIGIDIVDFEVSAPDLALFNESVFDMRSIVTGTVDVAYSRSVMEHLDNVDAAYAEIHRVLKPAGKYIFLTPNFWDYTSLISYVVPNFLHGRLVRFAEGRAERDTFPTFYRSNTYYRISRDSRKYRLAIQSFQYLGQYPSAFLFNNLMFRAAARYEKFLGRHEHLQFLRGWILCVLSKDA
ncbi:MAG: class I SAM-dependent methyltransferase [Geminicoccaceae bacterium]